MLSPSPPLPDTLAHTSPATLRHLHVHITAISQRQRAECFFTSVVGCPTPKSSAHTLPPTPRHPHLVAGAQEEGVLRHVRLILEQVLASDVVTAAAKVHVDLVYVDGVDTAASGASHCDPSEYTVSIQRCLLIILSRSPQCPCGTLGTERWPTYLYSRDRRQVLEYSSID